MNSVIRIVAIAAPLCVVALPMSGAAFGCEDLPARAADVSQIRLEPYGPLKWRDTLLEAVSKVRKIDGAADVEITLLRFRLPAAQVDRPERMQQWLGGLFSQTAAYRTEYLRETPALPRPYYDPGAQIEAKPLSLVGVGYSLKVTFRCEPGLIVADAEQVRRQSQEFFGAGAADDVPVVLSEVELLPMGVVSPEAHREIINSLINKYGPLRAKNPAGDDLNRDYLNLTFRDSEENTLDLYPGGKLTYRNGLVHREKDSLAERFREHQHNFDEQQRKSRAKQQPGALNDL